MHDTSTEAQAETENKFAFAVENARVEALNAIKFHTIKAVLSTVAASTDTHTEQAAKWACIARENGASEYEITAAEQDGLHFVRVFGDDGDDGEGGAWQPPPAL